MRGIVLPAVVLGGSILMGAGLGAIVRPGLERLGQDDIAGRMLAVEVIPSTTPHQAPATPSPVNALLTTSLEPASTAVVGMDDVPAVTPAVQEQPRQVEPRPAQAKAKPAQATIEYRYFNGRRIRPARTITMVTTAYSPDERSCGPDANGTTASGKSVWTNGMKMVAADTRLLPFGTLVSIPGYYDGQPVPVLDRGGAIKGHRLDLLYPSHERAMLWGKKRQTVTIWEYVD